ncbi:hypothetical protein FVEN_g793 [Fusarium venenatum]|uniref:Nephrocystin 3-like N-terminal domain-containing protein n=1 Tax=Fusarium venenatum TaxID=56646 RepID=A0A2L2TQ53_9HYPO|nr:uncharacterized protein FVRRES_10800 [Fusarium venenatum]KAG8361758.1 hypothetical protein FVEN_g793 [Fusarium venenatum]KAH6967377.1 ankyrin repeat-containing domain protein [Fusarium venenatum]CEI70723.1 unnamed protein product [Fusarium venenatum]
MLLNELDAPLDDVVVVDKLHIADYNEANILPQDETTLKRLLKWLSPTKYAGDGSELKKHATSHLKGTSQWLIESSIFEQWHRGNSHGILWIRGVPGTGKSVLAAKLIDHLISEEYPVLYFFSRYTIQSNHRPEAALRDWIAQILPFNPPLQLALKNLTSGDINIGSVDNLSMTELWHLLQLALKTIPKAYCVVDALDEMDHAFMEHFLQVLDQLGNIHPDRVKLIITSRPIATIEKIVRNLRLLDIRLGKDKVEPDIVKYLHHRMDHMSLAPEIRDAIIRELPRKANGLFLYAKFAMDAISELETMTVETVTKALGDAPIDLSAMYRNLLQEHMGRTDLPEGLCLFVLQLVTHATRPLRLLEIADCVKVTRPQMGEDTGILKSLIRTSCGPLLEILPDETVRVVHHSLTEYLFGLTRSSSEKEIPLFEPGPMHNLIALTCLSYLRAGSLDTLNVDGKYVWFNLRHKEYQLPSFLMYAANNWHVHAKKSSSEGFSQYEANSGIASLLMTSSYPKRLVMLGNNVKEGGERDLDELLRCHDIATEAEALLFAIHLDLTSFVKYFLSQNNGDAAKYPGVRGIESPLHMAIRKGNLNIVSRLITKGANTNHHNRRGETPLHVALGGTKPKVCICPAIIEHLLEVGADPWKDKGKDMESSWPNQQVPYPPIKKAFAGGDETISKLFLPYIKSKVLAQQALGWVINGSQKAEVLHMILDLGLVDINCRTEGQTPLFKACTELDPKAISVLLEAGADPTVLQDKYNSQTHRRFSAVEGEGRGLFHALAAPYRYLDKTDGEIPVKRIKECFELVLTAGADVNQADCHKVTPLHLARTPCITRLLLEAGANPLAMNENGSTPLHVAYSIDVIEVLLTKTDINTRNLKGETVLLSTFFDDDRHDRPNAKTAPEKALRLLHLGADPNMTDDNGDSILHHLASRGEMDRPSERLLLERLVQSGVDANIRNNEGQTAMYKIEFNKLSRVWSGMANVEVMLELTDIDINTVDKDGSTFLFRVMGNREIATRVRYKVDGFLTTMAKAGARFDVIDGQGQTLLHAAMRHYCGSDQILEFLVGQGVDPKQTDNEGNTIWHVLVPRFDSTTQSVNLFRKLTVLGVDVRKPNNYGRLPLHLSCEHYRRCLGDRIHPRTKFGTTLFDYMLEQGHEDINRADNGGVLPLHLVSTFSTNLTRMFLDAGANITQDTHEGLNVFHLAARFRQSNTIGLLLDWCRARMSTGKVLEIVNAKDKRGRNPLYYACVSGHYQSVELLIKAGAVIDLEPYEGSAIQGCVDFQLESEDWVERCNSAFDAVHFSDKTQPRMEKRWHLHKYASSGSQHDDRIEEILDLLMESTAPASWREIDRAIVIAADRKHDYTVESLLRVRKSLGIEAPLSCMAEVQPCLERRASLLVSVANVESVAKPYEPASKFYDQIKFMIKERLYHAIPSYIEDYSPKPKISEIYKVSLELVHSGHANLLDSLLTSDLVSDLEESSHSTKNGSRRESREGIESLLVSACQSEPPNLPAIKVLANKGAKPDMFSRPGCISALHAIVKTSDNIWWQTAQALPHILEQSIDLEVRDWKGLTPLNAILEEKDQHSFRFQATEMLLQAGADPSSVDNEGKSCLARAVGDEPLFKLLLSHGADVGPAALSAAILAKDVNMLEMMLAGGADPNARNVGDVKASRSVLGGTCEMVDPRDDTELYPLDLLIKSMGFGNHDAVSERMMELLFEYGADPNSRYPKTTIAHRSLETKSPDMGCVMPRPRTYFKRNCYTVDIVQHPLLDLDLRDGDGVTILQGAYKAGDLKAAQLLIDRGSNIYAQDKHGSNILHLSPKSIGETNEHQAQWDFLKYLVTLGPELLHQFDALGNTPLHSAILRRKSWGQVQDSEETIELFMSKGADVCAKNMHGDTPLHLLLEQDWNVTVSDNNTVLDESTKKLVNLFLSRGADINARNKAGETPVFSYFRQGNIRVVFQHDNDWRETFKSHRARMDWSEALEHKTNVEQEPNILALLDEFGVDWTSVDNDWQSLLHVVAANGGQMFDSNKREWMLQIRKQRFQFLMGKGLDASAENVMHRTALDFAAANKAENILALFNVS